MMTLANVQRIGIESAYMDIEAFLNEYDNEKTKKEYKRDIVEYFAYMHGKELPALTKEDIINTKQGVPITKAHAIEYRKHLIKVAKAKKPDGNYEGTVNRKMTTVRVMYEFLQGLGYNVNHLNFKLKKLKYVPESYDMLNKEQVIRLADHVLNYTYGQELHALIYLATQTSFRVEVLVNAEKKNVKKSDKDSIYLLTLIDKRNQKRTIGFEARVYDMIVPCIKENRLFPNLTTDNVHDAITRAAKELGFEGRITTHSLRSTAINYEIQNTGDIVRAMEQSGHKDIKTFKDHYVKVKSDYEQMAGVRMFRSVDEGVFDLVSKEELLELLKQTNKSAYEQIALKLQDIVGV